jgi:hypothetical protein
VFVAPGGAQDRPQPATRPNGCGFEQPHVLGQRVTSNKCNTQERYIHPRQHSKHDSNTTLQYSISSTPAQPNLVPRKTHRALQHLDICTCFTMLEYAATDTLTPCTLALVCMQTEGGDKLRPCSQHRRWRWLVNLPHHETESCAQQGSQVHKVQLNTLRARTPQDATLMLPGACRSCTATDRLAVQTANAQPTVRLAGTN